MIKESVRIHPDSALHLLLRKGLLMELQLLKMNCADLSRAMGKPAGTISILLLRGGKPSAWMEVDRAINKIQASATTHA